jgi:mono/diheme cytochrome c family protein
MNAGTFTSVLLFSALCIASTGCMNAPGKPALASEAKRPDQVVDFPILYKQNCAACHGDQGKNGAAVSLANPVYIAVAGVDNIQRVTAVGVPGTLMPAFDRASGGMLTDDQVKILAHGIVETWGRPGVLAGSTPPGYTSTTAGDPTRGQQAFTTFCARCHGSDGGGIKADQKGQLGSIVDPAYLALVSNQSLRTAILVGFPEQNMPDWRSDLTGAGARPMTDQEVTDVVAWMTAHRTATPGQPYQQHL